MKVFVDSYGCTLNQADAAIIKGILKNKGFELSNLDSAEAIILNTCAVKNQTESHMFSLIEKYKATRKKVIVTGCLPNINPQRLKALKVSVVDLNSLDELPKALNSEKIIDFVSYKHKDKLKMPYYSDDSITAIVPISEGCLGNCAYCGTKNARGTLTSYPLKEIKARVENLISTKKKEILITAQDCGCYGLDIGTNLVELLKEITSIQGSFKIRVGMMNPNHCINILDELVGCYKSEKLYKFLHIPVQSGSNRVLREMNRSYSIKEFESIVLAFRAQIPNITIATDIIVGFPTETDSDFEQTLQLIQRIKPGMTNISKFYPRPNTKAAKMKKLLTQTLKERSITLSELYKQISLENNRAYVGKEVECLVTGQAKQGQVLARTQNYRQVILDKKPEDYFIKVKITDAGPRFLKGEQINT